MVPKSQWVWKNLGGWWCGSCQALLIPYLSHWKFSAISFVLSIFSVTMVFQCDFQCHIFIVPTHKISEMYIVGCISTRNWTRDPLPRVKDVNHRTMLQVSILVLSINAKNRHVREKHNLCFKIMACSLCWIVLIQTPDTAWGNIVCSPTNCISHFLFIFYLVSFTLIPFSD